MKKVLTVAFALLALTSIALAEGKGHAKQQTDSGNAHGGGSHGECWDGFIDEFVPCN